MLCFQYIFHPQVLCCYGKHLCTIPRDATYWTYQNRYVFWKWQKTFILKCEQNNKCDFSNFTWLLTGRSEDSDSKVAQCRKLYSCRPLVCLLKNNVPVINLVFHHFCFAFLNIINIIKQTGENSNKNCQLGAVKMYHQTLRTCIRRNV